VRAVVLAQATAQDFVGALLRFDVDGGIDRQTTLGHTSRVLVFQLLSDVLNWVIEDCRFGLRIVVGSIR
jgi:hypothetical protein